MTQSHLNDLFQHELETQFAVLTTGLLQLEMEGPSAGVLDDLMRSAHSIKGAARSVNSSHAVKVAHALEERLVKARHQIGQVDTLEIDVLLAAVDLLRQVGQTADPSSTDFEPDVDSEVDRCVARLQEGLLHQKSEPQRSEAVHSLSTRDRLSPRDSLSASCTGAAHTAGLHSPSVSEQVLVQRDGNTRNTEQTAATMPVWPVVQACDPLQQLFYDQTCLHAGNVYSSLWGAQSQLQSADSARNVASTASRALQDNLQAIAGTAQLVQADQFSQAIQQFVSRLKTVPAERIDGLIPVGCQLASTIVELVGEYVQTQHWSAWPVDIEQALQGLSTPVETPQPVAVFSALEPLAVSNTPQTHYTRQTQSEQSEVSRGDRSAVCEPLAEVVSAPDKAAPGPILERRSKQLHNLVELAEQRAAEESAADVLAPLGGIRSTAAANLSADRTVRVAARSLSRLMSLAGAALVESRWLQTLGQQMLKLKRTEDQLSHRLAELQQRYAETHLDDVGRDLLVEVRQGMAGALRQINQQLTDLELHVRQSDDLNSRLYQEVQAARMEPFAHGTANFPRLVRDLARELGKQARLELVGAETGVDREILERLEGALNHLIRNSLDHGIETPAERINAGKPAAGTVTLEAVHRAGSLLVTIRDDGRGVNLDAVRKTIIQRQLSSPDLVARMTTAELLDFLFLPGFTTQTQVSEISGRGVGLDAMRSTVQQLGGSIRVHSVYGEGTSFTLQLPITLSVVRAVIATVAGEQYAFPHNRIERLLRVSRGELQILEGRQFITIDGNHVGLVSARALFGLPEIPPDEEIFSVLVMTDERHSVGLVVDRFIGEQDLVVRPLDPRLGRVPDIAAASLLEDGTPVLIADADDLLRSLDGGLSDLRPSSQASHTSSIEHQQPRVLIVEDSPTVREVERSLLEPLGCRVDVAVDGLDGWHAIQTGQYNLIVTDIDMPRLSGLDLLELIRSDRRFVGIPVVIVSYKDRAEDRAAGRSLGAQAYLSKSSFHDETFVSTIRQLLHTPQREWQDDTADGQEATSMGYSSFSETLEHLG